MAIIASNLQNIQTAMQNDANTLRTFYSWAVQRNVTYGQQMTVANMNAAGISSSDQNGILAFIADVARIVSFMNGNPQVVAGNVPIDIAGVLGVS